MSETTGWSAAEVLRDFADIVETYETGKQAAAAMRVMADIEAQLAAASPDTAAPVDATLTVEFIGYENGWVAQSVGGEEPEALFQTSIPENGPLVAAQMNDLAQRAAVDHAKIERVEVLRDRWTRLAAEAMDPDCREWLTAASSSLAAALGDATTTRPPPCPSRWASNRGVHCAEREGHPGQHTNGVVSWSEAEAAG